MKGNAEAGARTFAAKRNQCITCHRVGKDGGQIGPALDGIGKRLKRAEILESILQPSKKIDPKFAAWTALTADGKVHTGLMVDRSESGVVLRTPKNENITIAKDDLEELFQQPVSLMPDRLLNDMDDQEIADLLEYLATRHSSALPGQPLHPARSNSLFTTSRIKLRKPFPLFASSFVIWSICGRSAGVI